MEKQNKDGKRKKGEERDLVEIDPSLEPKSEDFSY